MEVIGSVGLHQHDPGFFHFQILEPRDGCIEDGFGVQRRDDFAPQLVESVLKQAGDSEDVHVAGHGHDLAGVGDSFALVWFGVGAAPGPASEGKLLTLGAGGGISVQRRAMWGCSLNRKSPPERALLSFYFYFIGLAEIIGQVFRANFDLGLTPGYLPDSFDTTRDLKTSV
jgi:hypothetical protein